MAKKVSKLSVREEAALKTIGNNEGLCTNEHGLALRTLESLMAKGLLFSGDVFDPATSKTTKRGWFLSSEGFFIFKQLQRGKSFHSNPTPSPKKGSVK